MNKLVSIIMPCYNGEGTVERAIRGVMDQTYRPIELILVNDGSTDGTDSVIRSLESEIKNCGVMLRYVQQQNRGLGGAINTGLKYFTGEYLAWIDADDELLPQSVELRVAFLDEHLEYASVTSDAYSVCEDNWNVPIGKVADGLAYNLNDNQFEHLLLRRSIFCSGCHLVRTEAFLKVNPDRTIYPARHGQNWQMLLPIYYHYRRGFLNIPLYKYGVSQTSMTATLSKSNPKDQMERELEYLDIVRETIMHIPDMPNDKQNKYMALFAEQVYRNNLYTAIGAKDISNYLHYLSKLAKINRLEMTYFTFPFVLVGKRILKFMYSFDGHREK